MATLRATGANDLPSPIASEARQTPALGSSTSVRHAPAVLVKSAVTGLAPQSQVSCTDTLSCSPGAAAAASTPRAVAASMGLASRAVSRFRPGSAGDSAIRTRPPPTTALAKAGPASTLPF